MDIKEKYRKSRRKNTIIIIISALAAAILFIADTTLSGSSGIGFSESMRALFGDGSRMAVNIVQNIRLPRTLAALIAGAGLAMSGYVMQTVLSNPMASPSTLGTANGAVFGADIAIIILGGNTAAAFFSVSATAFAFALLSSAAVLMLSARRSFRSEIIILAGLAAGSFFSSASTVLHYYADGTELGAALLRQFGDLSRADFGSDAVMLAAVMLGGAYFLLSTKAYNALSGGNESARSLGINVKRLTVISVMFASLITGIIVSYLGVIGFIGLAAPHAVKKFCRDDSGAQLLSSAFAGSILLLGADILSRTITGSNVLPIGAVTALLGAPVFIRLIVKKGEKGD